MHAVCIVIQLLLSAGFRSFVTGTTFPLIDDVKSVFEGRGLLYMSILRSCPVHVTTMIAQHMRICCVLETGLPSRK
jgi:hypothetical protein